MLCSFVGRRFNTQCAWHINYKILGLCCYKYLILKCFFFKQCFFQSDIQYLIKFVCTAFKNETFFQTYYIISQYLLYKMSASHCKKKKLIYHTLIFVLGFILKSLPGFHVWKILQLGRFLWCSGGKVLISTFLIVTVTLHFT